MAKKEEVEMVDLDDKVINECFDVADKLWEKIMEKYYHDNSEGLDAGCIMFRMMAHGIHTCKGFGWTKEDLQKELDEHFKPENMK